MLTDEVFDYEYDELEEYDPYDYPPPKTYDWMDRAYDSYAYPQSDPCTFDFYGEER